MENQSPFPNCRFTTLISKVVVFLLFIQNFQDEFLRYVYPQVNDCLMQCLKLFTFLSWSG